MSLNKKCFFILIFVLSLVVNLNAKTPVEMYGNLRVSGSKIVSESGEPVQLKGMSLFWSQWGGDYFDKPVIDTLVKEWNCSLVRAPFGAINGSFKRRFERDLLKIYTVIDAAIANGIYVIVDWHDHKAEKHPEFAKSFFLRIAKKYPNTPNIIYEIYNEPLGVSWSNVVKPYAENIIKSLRSLGVKNLVVVGTPNWSQDVDAVIGNEIDDSNVCYTFHFYAGTHKEEFRVKADKAIKSGIPLFVTEWGCVNADGDGAVDYKETYRWLKWMDENNLSSANWAISRKTEGASALKPHWAIDLSEKNLTESGKLVKKYLTKQLRLN